ncbi:hypothetical protein [Bacteroides acidifaciens]|uniref:hypothetical protein n=1 Tax=Bacteroides acidifaciens TaxID=85831 RepID=UPI0030144B6A
MGLIHCIWKQAKGRGRIRYNYTWQKPAIEAYIRHSSDKKNAKCPKNRGVLADVQKRHISLSINGLNQKREIHIVRANACPHYAIILAIIAESTMNKGIRRRYESMRAKREIIPVGGLRKMNLGEN